MPKEIIELERVCLESFMEFACIHIIFNNGSELHVSSLGEQELTAKHYFINDLKVKILKVVVGRKLEYDANSIDCLQIFKSRIAKIIATIDRRKAKVLNTKKGKYLLLSNGQIILPGLAAPLLGVTAKVDCQDGQNVIVLSDDTGLIGNVVY